MIWQVAVVFVFLPIIGQGLERGEQCTNTLGEEATCTSIYSCKAAIDAAAAANGSRIYAAGIVCGFDNEPLVCCKTITDFNESSNNNADASVNSTVIILTESDLTTFTNSSDFNESVQIFKLPTNITVRSPDTLVSTDVLTNIPSANDTTAFIASIFGTPPPSVIADDLPEVNNETTSSITTIPPEYVTGTPIITRLTESPEQSAATDVLPLQANENTEEDSDEPIYSTTIVSTSESGEKITVPPTVINLTRRPEESEDSEECDCSTYSDEIISAITTDPSITVTRVSDCELNVTLSPEYVTGSPNVLNLTTSESTEQSVDADVLPLQLNETSEEPNGYTVAYESSSPTTVNVMTEPKPLEHLTEPPVVIELTTTKPPVPSVALDVVPLQSHNTFEVLDESSPSPITESSPGYTHPWSSTEPSVVQEVTTQDNLDHILPDGNVCGYQLKRNRLPNAVISSIDEFPWMALLKYKDGHGKDVGFKCVGTLITNRHVITSSHCVTDGPASFQLKSIRLGEWSISSPSDCVPDDKGMICPDKVVDVGIEKIFLQPERKNNIALIRLERRVTFTDFVRPICLPIEHLRPPSDRSMLISSGWGASKDGCLLDIKSKIRLPALSKEKCSGKVSNLEDQACVDALSKNKFCKTDYGGPVMVMDEENKSQWYLEGVISEGFFCNNYGSVGLYTRVTKHISWIVSTLRGEGV